MLENQTTEKTKRVFYTTGQKLGVADTYKDILHVIYCFGSGVMLQDQLQQILILSGRYKRRASVISALARLTEYDIVTTTRLSCYRSKFIVLKGFAWKFVLGAANTRDAHYPTKFSTATYNRSVFKTQFIIERYLKTTKACKSDKHIVEDILQAIENERNSVLYNKSNVLKYMQTHLSSYSRSEKYMTEVVKLEAIAERDHYNLMHSDKKKADVKDLPKSYMRTLHEQSSFIAFVSEQKVHVMYMGFCSSDSLAPAAKAYVSALNVATDVFGVNSLAFHICVPDVETGKALHKSLTTHRLSPVGKQPAKYTSFQSNVNRYANKSGVVDSATLESIKIVNLNTIKYLR